MSWKKLFERHILDRGYNYYMNGAVENIEVEDSTITAYVAGTEEYEVEITIYNGKVAEMYCSCPYASGGKSCKHMAAVLYEWSEKYSDDEKGYSIDSALFDAEYDITDHKRKKMAVEILVDNADIKYLKSFLVDILAEDERLMRNFYNGANKHKSKYDTDIYKKQIDNVVDSYYSADGFIDYDHADDFIYELEEIIESAAYNLTGIAFMGAFEVIDYALKTIDEVDMDDSNGGILYLVGRASRLWPEMIAELSEDDKNTVFDWFVTMLENRDLDYLEESIENIIMEEFAGDEYLQPKLQIIEKMIEKSKQNEYEYSRKYKVGKWTVKYLELLKENGVSADILNQECKKYWENSVVRKYWIDTCIKNKNYDEALSALDESILLDKDYRGLVCEHNKKKKEIYLLQGNKNAYIEQMWRILVDYNDGNLELFKELKQQYTEEEWLFQREQLFANLSNSIYIAEFYKEEKQYYRLLKYVTDYPGLSKLQKYEDVLKKDYSVQILEKYTYELNGMAVQANNRKQYKNLVAILRKMRKFDDGKQCVEQIVADWRMTYKKRPAMMEELNKL